MQQPLSAIEPVKTLGVDEFALRWRRLYATILVNLNKRRPLALLLGREAEPLAQWLKKHQQVEILSRDPTHFGFWILDFGFWIMNEEQFKERTKKLALRIIKLVEALPSSHTAQVIGKQVLRSGTSIDANYRAACRAKSSADILSKLAIVEEEADETLYWLELLVEAQIVPESRLRDLMNETSQIVAMIVASIKTIRNRQNGHNPKSKI